MTQENDDLEDLRLPELRARFQEVVGEETRCPNRTFLIRRIREAVAAERPHAALEETSLASDITEGAAEEAMPLVVSGESQPALHHDIAELEPKTDADVEPQDGIAAAHGDASESVAEHAPPLFERSGEPDLAKEEPAVDEDRSPVSESIAVAASDQPPVIVALTPPSSFVVPVIGTVRARDRPKPRSTAPSAAPRRHERGRFKSMTIEELRAMYLSVVGRATGSTDARYLVWKIREAEKGRVPIGPRESRTPEQQSSGDAKVLPFRIEAHALERMDGVWRALGIRSRMEFFRRALGHYLTHIGANDAAAMFVTT